MIRYRMLLRQIGVGNRWMSAQHQVSPENATRVAEIPSKLEAILRSDYDALDSKASHMLKLLHASTAPVIWHKHGSFLDHLRDVWFMLCAWDQPQSWCRLGLFHSAYSNSFVSMKAFDINTDRDRLAELIGADAENLVYKFCVINRQQLEDSVETNLKVQALDFKHIHTGENVQLSNEEAAACITETIADQMDQSFSWQSDLEDGFGRALWPGPFEPTLRMAKLSRFAYGLRQSGVLPQHLLPPVFNKCTTIMDPQDEKNARDLYVHVIFKDGHTLQAPGQNEIDMLTKASTLNPFIAEPHLTRAQILLQMARYDEARIAAQTGLDILCQWATPWDKRMPFHAWLNWTRCLIFQANLQEWPNTHGGLESLGAIDPSQRSRGLNTSRML
uniref:DUF6817 domain-containing protein n=1 Tax=Aureoumbra lagunensis TaxID=44058 RepID=A0A7S3NN65_9STRA|mmetsp:Transcript_15777/g.20770  ORF Transcript_15777/g.20770 Transcript_15777/m.20770 type:complete len:388 (+) Transcript_15777:30-1193(+)